VVLPCRRLVGVEELQSVPLETFLKKQHLLNAILGFFKIRPPFWIFNVIFKKKCRKKIYEGLRLEVHLLKF
jgi:hypothetical protein